MINRGIFLNRINRSLKVHSVCGILGPRQCGKTTLAKRYAETTHAKHVHYFDLEDPQHIERLENPKVTLEPLEGLIIIDEIQRRPNLFPYLRSYVDKFPDRKLLILGSASRDLIQQSSETLAGRIGYIELTPFMLKETSDLTKLWQRGGFPSSFLAEENIASEEWRTSFIRTFLETDLSLLGFNVPSYDMRRLWSMLAHYHGNTINYAELSRSLAISEATVKKYVSLLQGTFMVRLLRPWHENLKKRQVKTPKVYIRDSGILHTLLGIDTDNLHMHPKVGASWEGFALEEVIRATQTYEYDCYYWGTRNKAELDLLTVRGLNRSGFEFKYTDSPKITKSMHIAMEDLQLEEITIIIPGDHSFSLSENVHVRGLSRFIQEEKT